MSYPDCERKYGSQAIFSPADSLGYRRQLGIHTLSSTPEGIILTYQPSAVDYILGLEDGRSHHYVNYGLYPLGIGNKGMYLCQLGATGASMAMEDLIASGSKRFINLGIAGGLQGNLQAGDVILCKAAIRDEGVSHHYLKPDKLVQTSTLLSERLKQALTRSRLSFLEGTTWTIATPYRETFEKIKLYQKEGVLTVELETAALAAVAWFRGVEFAATFVVSDLLADGVWRPRFHTDIVQSRLNDLHRIALAIL